MSARRWIGVIIAAQLALLGILLHRCYEIESEHTYNAAYYTASTTKEYQQKRLYASLGVLCGVVGLASCCIGWSKSRGI